MNVLLIVAGVIVAAIILRATFVFWLNHEGFVSFLPLVVIIMAAAVVFLLEQGGSSPSRPVSAAQVSRPTQPKHQTKVSIHHQATGQKAPKRPTLVVPRDTRQTAHPKLRHPIHRHRHQKAPKPTITHHGVVPHQAAPPLPALVTPTAPSQSTATIVPTPVPAPSRPAVHRTRSQPMSMYCIGCPGK